MANKVNQSAPISSPFNTASFEAIGSYLTQLVNTLSSEFRDHALRLNKAIVNDGTEVPIAPVMLKSYVKTALPDALAFMDGLIIVSNDVGGLTLAFSDGTNWRRTADRNIIS